MLSRILQAITFALVAAAPLSAQVADAAGVAEVRAVQSTRVADLVILGGGFDAGFRQGMVCHVTRGSERIAEVLLVELRPAASAALILSIAPGQAIRAGDRAVIKVLKS